MVSQNPTIFLFAGNDSYSKDKAVEKLKADLSKGSSEGLDYKIFRGAEAEAGEIISNLRTKPLFSERHLVLIKDIDAMAKDGIRLLAGVIKDLPKTTCLVLESKDDSVLDKYPEFNDRVSVKVFGELKGQSLLSWASGFVSSVSGKTIDKDAVFLLSELKGNLPIDLAGELEKLIAFVGERKSIKASDVEELVGRSVEASAFDIGWQIGRRDAASALRLVSDLMRSGKRPHEIVGVISWHLNRLLKALELRGNGRCDNDIAAELGIRWKDTDAFFGQMKAFDINGVRSKIKALLAADLDIKRSRYDQGMVLEFAVIRLCLT